ncbi:hypothetical protein RJ639_007569 [Escallonia herrerae]|uniref:Uncharacterized protein n=1 Tax=Escallonia herrerae TaxID=1293975 RepID=A0AA88VZC0_9ASTE|nr:hypothetical protein RJ639_007569 [Escallonia herrerae]
MPDMEIMICEFVAQLTKRKIEGLQATARLTAELLRTVVSQQRLPPTNQAMALIEAVRGVGERLIAANPVGMHLNEAPIYLYLHRTMKQQRWKQEGIKLNYLETDLSVL